MKNVVNKIKETAKEIFKDKKRLAIIGGGIVLLIVIIVIVVFLLGGKSKSHEEQLKANLEELGRAFYEELYYPNTKNGDEEERAKFLAGFEQIGLKFNIDNLARYEYKSEDLQEKLNSFTNDKTNEECDKKESKLIVYPTSPYGIKDYRVEVVLECGYEAE